VLAERGFRLLLGTRLLGQLSDGILQAGLASYVLFSPERQATGAAIAASFAVLLLPYSIVGPFAGVLIDRWRRRQILLGANILRACIAVALAALVLHGADSAGFIALALAALGVNRFILAALSAALPHVVTPVRLVTANAVSTTSGTVATATGAGAGLAARFWAGSGDAAAAGIVVAAAGAYLLAAVVASMLRRDQLGPDRSAGADGRAGAPPPRLGVREDVRELVAGVRYLHGVQRAWNALAALGVYRVTFGVMTVIVVLEQRGLFHRPGDADGGLRGVSVTFAALAIGVPLGALATPAAVRRWGIGRWVPAQLVLTGVGLALLALPFRAPPLVGAAFVLGFGGQAVKVSVDSAVQRTVDDEHRGLVFALYDVLFNVAFVAAVAFTAALSAADGRSPWLVVFAAAILVTAGLWYRRVTPPGWRPGQEEMTPAQTPAHEGDHDDGVGPDSGWSVHQASSSDSAVAASTGPRSRRRSSRKR
jgi:MFS family permease